MPKKDPYTCSVCKKLHIGANCWSEDSDEDIDSGLLQAMRTLVPREPPDVVDDPEVTPDQQSRPQSVSSTDSWERGDPSYVHEEHISTPPIHGQATPSSLSNRRGENKAFFVNTDVLDANEYRQQTLDTDIVGSQARIDSGIQERRRSDEYHMPSPRAYHFSQISALPQPLQLHDRQAQREHDDQYRRSGEYEQPDVQPRRSDEYERDQRIAREYSDTSGYLRRDEGDYQPQTARERGGRAQYQHPQQEDRMSPPPRREPQYPPRGSHDHPSKFRTSQEAMDEKAARQYGHGQSNKKKLNMTRHKDESTAIAETNTIASVVKSNTINQEEKATKPHVHSATYSSCTKKPEKRKKHTTQQSVENMPANDTMEAINDEIRRKRIDVPIPPVTIPPPQDGTKKRG
ncbi:hypothetical protein Vi05172_g7340 [Venturia inaequalis]|nr:hypothetical protein Vi05172_g7340 [Venturia inaequalis]